MYNYKHLNNFDALNHYKSFYFRKLRLQLKRLLLFDSVMASPPHHTKIFIWNERLYCQLGVKHENARIKGKLGLRLAGYGRTGHAHTGIFRLQLKGSLAIFIYVLFRVSMIYNPASTSRILNFDNIWVIYRFEIVQGSFVLHGSHRNHPSRMRACLAYI